jgi:glycosyltransferase involved in cell wall biosynthesis
LLLSLQTYVNLSHVWGQFQTADRNFMISVSVIICTRDRGQALRQALDSVAAAAEVAAALGASTEIVLVDNGSRDATATLAREWASSSKLSVTIISEPRQGLSIARNSGLRHASGTILVFTDDDCRMAPDYLERTLAHYSMDQGPVVRGGRVELGDPTDLPFTIKTSTKDAVLTSIFNRDGFIAGCNMTMRRDVPQIIGVFDERFGAGGRFKAAEDTDFIYRAYAADIRTEYKADMVVYHWHGRKDNDELKKLHRGYSIGIGALRAKHGVCMGLRFTYYDVRNLLLGAFKGRRSNRQLGLTHGSLVWWTMVGMMLYFTSFAARGRSSK